MQTSLPPTRLNGGDVCRTKEFWKQYPEYGEYVSRIVLIAKKQIGLIDLDDEIKGKIEELMKQFIECVGSTSVLQTSSFLALCGS